MKRVPFSQPETVEEVTEQERMRLHNRLSARQWDRSRLEQEYGEVWDTRQVQENFQIHGFLAPFCSATRRKDGAFGILTFQHFPRYYFQFIPADADGKIDIPRIVGVADLGDALSKVV